MPNARIPGKMKGGNAYLTQLVKGCAGGSRVGSNKAHQDKKPRNKKGKR